MPERNEREGTQALTDEGETDWAYLEAMAEEEAHQNALADPDIPPLTKEQLARMRRAPNPRQIREQLGLMQRELSRQFEIALGTPRDWEQGARRPDSAAKAYPRVIQRNPEAVRAALDPSSQSAAAPRAS